MTDKEINIAIAEVRRWNRTSNSGSGWQAPDGRLDSYPPDYCHDLNAMHEAWLSTSHTNYRQHWQELYQVVQRDWNKNNPDDRFHYLHQHFRKALIANATARQRAEAFLRTLGKWSDSSDDKYALAAAKCL